MRRSNLAPGTCDRATWDRRRNHAGEQVVELELADRLSREIDYLDLCHLHSLFVRPIDAVRPNFVRLRYPVYSPRRS